MKTGKHVSYATAKVTVYARYPEKLLAAKVIRRSPLNDARGPIAKTNVPKGKSGC